MASSQYTTVNLSNLPQSEEAQDTDFIILQTINGTQIIPFGNFNVVKTDISGNATVTGNLTGENIIVSNINTQSLSSNSFTINGVPGVTVSNSYYNDFTITNGLVTSARYVSQSDPDYVYLVGTYIPTTLNALITAYKRVYDSTQTASVASTPATSVNLILNNFFVNYPAIVATNLTPANFIITPGIGNTTVVSTLPYVTDIANDGFGNLTYTLNFGGSYSNLILLVRILVTY